MVTSSPKKPAKTTKPKKKATSRTKKTGSKKSNALPDTSGKQLVIVESPAKARTVGQILGRKYVVTASQGHVRDLPKGKMGVDLEQDFEPSYVTMRDKRSLLTSLKKAGDQAKDIYLATDPDREGEAISWHLQTATGWDQKTVPPKRVVFHEITKQAVEEAFQHPREIDMKLVNAQQARRILDRLVGYQLSPLLWRRVQRGLSAGRVQSVCLRMVVDRESEIKAFIPVESWTIDAELKKNTDTDPKPHIFPAALHSITGSKTRISIGTEDEASTFRDDLTDADYSVSDIRKRNVRQRPAAPFTTSTMQQEAGRKLRFSAQRTMVVAQQLYEGLSVGTEGSVGLITYMRTDSVQVAESAVDEARDYVIIKYGKEYLPDKPRQFKTRSKSAQEAHEAIRPTSIKRDPESLKSVLNNDQYRLYNLIWSRMLASQMADAKTEATTIDIDAKSKKSTSIYNFRATGSVLIFPGFRTLYLESQDDNDDDDNQKTLPKLDIADVLKCVSLNSNQHFTQPPPRFTEATLIKAMEEKGIGRPSTYAPTIGTILDRNYVEREQTRLFPTILGTTVADLLKEYFIDIMDPNFTARMEEELDEVSTGDREWVPMLHEFYGPFEQALDTAQEKMPRIRLEEETDEVCETCESPMVIKTGRFGRFMACTGFPDCRNTKPILKKTGCYCPKCSGDIVERKGKGRGRPFFGCSQYPNCDFITNHRPLLTPCPECKGLMVESKKDEASCIKCSWQEPILNEEDELTPVAS